MPQRRFPQTGWSLSSPSARALSMLARPRPPPLALGLVVAAVLIVAETVLGYLLGLVAPEDTLGVVYLLGVVVVAMGWGFWLAAGAAVASTAAFDFFLIAPIWSLTVTDSRDWVALAVFLIVALLASTLADSARRAAEADQRRREAELSGELGRMIVEEQSALRRVATLVALGADPPEVFAAVARELARVLGVQNAAVWRYEPDGAATLVAAHDAPDAKKMPVGKRFTLEGDNIAAMVLQTSAVARMDSHDYAAGSAAAEIRELDLQGGVGAPIIVEGRLWGAAIVGTSRPEPLPPDTEARVADFADLVATAIANAATRDELQASRGSLAELATHQSALRRVATLVARGAGPTEVFSVVAEEMARCLNSANAGVGRFEGDEVVVLAVSQFDQEMKNVPVVGERIALEGDNFVARVFRTGAAARVDVSESQNAPGTIAGRVRDLGLGCTVAVPIVVDGHLWGTATVGAAEPLPPDTEARMGDFADLVATAIANAATRSQLDASQHELRMLAEQQSALRRVAILVAREVPPTEVFSAVAGELARRLEVHHTSLFRYESDGAATLLAARHDGGLIEPAVGQRFSFEGDNLARLVFDTGRAARMDSHDNASGEAAARIRWLAIRSAVGVPIIVGDRLWGVAIVGTSRPEPLPPDTEARVAEFADLVATAIANAATRAELIASRARIVAAADDARRRLERDLHDGAQQRLVALGLGLRAAEVSVPDELQPLKEHLAGLVTTAAAVSAEMQEISRGIHPAILSRGGLGPALKTLARRCTVPVVLDLHVDQRFADSVEVGAYYVVAEALTNAAKHARASVVEVCAYVTSSSLRLELRDDGIGGATAGKGSGLTGLVDRVEALGGKMTIQSPVGGGTSLLVDIPLETD
jgi:signal transduction histidine kinase